MGFVGDTIDVIASEAHIDKVTLVVVDLVGMATNWTSDRRRAVTARFADQSVEWGGGVQGYGICLLIHFGSTASRRRFRKRDELLQADFNAPDALAAIIHDIQAER